MSAHASLHLCSAYGGKLEVVADGESVSIKLDDGRVSLTLTREQFQELAAACVAVAETLEPGVR